MPDRSKSASAPKIRKMRKVGNAYRQFVRAEVPIGVACWHR
jgi:hypothetical protein